MDGDDWDIPGQVPSLPLAHRVVDTTDFHSIKAVLLIWLLVIQLLEKKRLER
jgi:hypothetical protein